jgi:hypothetical protein
MFKITIPQQSRKGDVTFFPNGIRFSNDFIQRENLTEAKHVWIFVDEPFLGFLFSVEANSYSVKLTYSGKNTLGKTAHSAYLKKYKWIEKIMNSKNVNNRKFTVEKTNEQSEVPTLRVKYKVNLNENMSDADIPF